MTHDPTRDGRPVATPENRALARGAERALTDAERHVAAAMVIARLAGADDDPGCGGCDNDEHCGACPCCAYDLSPEAAVAASDCASFMASRDLRYRGGTLDRCGCDGPHLATCPLREADHGA